MGQSKHDAGRLFDGDSSCNSTDMFDISTTIKHVTEKAVLITEDGENEVWLPKSQIEVNHGKAYGPGDTVIIAVPEWLAIEEDLV